MRVEDVILRMVCVHRSKSVGVGCSCGNLMPVYRWLDKIGLRTEGFTVEPSAIRRCERKYTLKYFFAWLKDTHLVRGSIWMTTSITTLSLSHIGGTMVLSGR